jgi:hypothetical protein
MKSNVQIVHGGVENGDYKSIHRAETCVAAGARASARFTVRPPAAPKTNPALNSIRPFKRRQRRAPVCRNSKPFEFERFRNYGEFAIIRNQAGEFPSVLIPSNSTGLETPAATTFHN